MYCSKTALSASKPSRCQPNVASMYDTRLGEKYDIVPLSIRR
jgi:hypothetical protein